MIRSVDLTALDLMEAGSALDDTRRLRVAFPVSAATGTAASACVYFELDPGMHLGVHTDSAEELLVVLDGEGEGLVGHETAPVRAGQVLVVPASVRHDMTNTGTGVLRVLGTFAAASVVSVFEESLEPGGPRVFVAGGPLPIALPLDQPPSPSARTRPAATRQTAR